MPRIQKGETRNPNGRPLGTNKRYIERKAAAVAEMLDHADADPIYVLARIIVDETEKMAYRLKAAEIILPYLLPKLKSIELSGSKDNPLKMFFNGVPFNPAQGTHHNQANGDGNNL